MSERDHDDTPGRMMMQEALDQNATPATERTLQPRPQQWDHVLALAPSLVSEGLRARLFDSVESHQADIDLQEFWFAAPPRRHQLYLKWSLVAAATEQRAKACALQVKIERAKLDGE